MYKYTGIAEQRLRCVLQCYASLQRAYNYFKYAMACIVANKMTSLYDRVCIHMCVKRTQYTEYV